MMSVRPDGVTVEIFDAAPGSLRAVGLALPGPVDLEAGGVDSPSRMPGWPGFAKPAETVPTPVTKR